MTGWVLALAALPLMLEAARAHRRDRAPAGPRARRPSLAVLAALGRRPARHMPALIARDVDADLVRRAGMPIATADGPAARTGSFVIFAALGLLAWVALTGVIGAAAAGGLVAFGWVYPDAWLRAAARRRTERIERSAPAMLELVAAGVEAGVPLDVAVEAAARAVGGELEAEIDRSRRSIALGRPRHEELRDLGLRTGSETLAALALALRLSERLGVPLAQSLRGQADRSRVQAARAVQERAARAGPRVLAVVVFVLVPAALVPVAAAVALTVAGAIGGR